jgi:hypothetical protein
LAKALRKEGATKAMATWETVIHSSPELMMGIDFLYFARQKKSGAATTDNQCCHFAPWVRSEAPISARPYPGGVFALNSFAWRATTEVKRVT